jgi:hypothetical protein
MKMQVLRRPEVPKKARLYWVWEVKVKIATCKTHYPEKCDCHEHKQMASPAY